MKLKTIVILIFILFALAFVAYYGYGVYQLIAGSEELSGEVEKIPEIAAIESIKEKGEADWPNWRGPNFDGKSLVKDIDLNWSDGLEKLWQIDYLCQGTNTASWSAPVVKGNRLIVPGRNETHDIVFCINTENGELIWQNSYEAATQTNHGPGARATAFIDSNYVYTFGRNGDLVCWNLPDGKKLWHKNVMDLGGKEPDWGHSSTPLVYKNMVIVHGGGDALVCAFDKISGDLLWKSMQGNAGYSFTMVMTTKLGDRLIVYHGTGIASLLPENGKVLWNLPWETEYYVNATTPIISGNYIFHTSGYETGCRLIKVENDKPEIVYENKDFSAQHSDPILIDGYLYGYSGQSYRNTGDFKCIEMATGKEMWSTAQIGQGTTIYVDGYLICLDIKGNLFLVEPSSEQFTLVGEIKNAIEEVKNPSWTVPVAANGKLFLRYMQRLVCYKLEN